VTGRARTVAAVAGTILLAVATVVALAAGLRYYHRQAGHGALAATQHTAGHGPKSTDPSPSPGPSAVQASLPNTGFRYLGVYEGSDTSVSQYAQVEQFAQTVGQQPNIVLQYYSWAEPFNIPFAQTALRHGATLLIDLDPTGTSCAAIAAGQQDAFLQSFAQSVKAFGYPVIVSFGHEMNGNWYTWGWTQTQPAVFVQTWQHVVDVFRQSGADNVTWLWTVNAVSSGEGPIADYWPGASYVTWVGLDSYYYYPDDSFSSVFSSSIAAIRQVSSKPILIGETAIGQVSGQAANVPGLFAGVSSSGLLGFVWYDIAQNYGIYHQDWRLEGNPSAIAAFRAAAATYLASPAVSTPGQVVARDP
jgi:mannan endo-1,4-beta-mannosidase